MVPTATVTQPQCAHTLKAGKLPPKAAIEYAWGDYVTDSGRTEKGWNPRDMKHFRSVTGWHTKKRRDLRDLDLYGHKWDSTLQHAEPLDWSYLYCWTPLASKMLRHSRAKDSATEHMWMCFSIVQSWRGDPEPHNVEGSDRKATGSHAPQNRACTVYQITKLE